MKCLPRLQHSGVFVTIIEWRWNRDDDTSVHLHSQNSEHDEKGAADEDNVPDGPQRCDQGLNHQF